MGLLETPQLTADGPTLLDGTDIAGPQNAFTTFGVTTECPDSSYHGEAVGGGRIEAGASAFTLLPEYATCSLGGLKTTAHANGCDYVVHIGEALGEEEHAVTFDLLCPEGQTVDFEIFASSKNENTKVCTVLLGSQTGLKGAALRDIGKGEYELTGTLEGIEASESGGCGTESTGEGKYDLAVGLLETPQGQLTTDGPTLLDGTDVAGQQNAFTTFGVTTECPDSSYRGEASAGGESKPERAHSHSSPNMRPAPSAA